ncbi:hypothetical protein CBR_g8325 [Chara braunii]|uniref:proline--tRNA ligase n=1 Tax=Chara braunii TaxID=69332 RepID=A0A388KLW5_CHABU|nr:hypothetical protein CBR_g8325 [Chara braunii]|eukprot:GBG71027.1 hypothetical protein CBR_g8325 [Chara braunii]
MSRTAMATRFAASAALRGVGNLRRHRTAADAAVAMASSSSCCASTWHDAGCRPSSSSPCPSCPSLPPCPPSSSSSSSSSSPSTIRWRIASPGRSTSRAQLFHGRGAGLSTRPVSRRSRSSCCVERAGWMDERRCLGWGSRTSAGLGEAAGLGLGGRCRRRSVVTISSSGGGLRSRAQGQGVAAEASVIETDLKGREGRGKEGRDKGAGGNKGGSGAGGAGEAGKICPRDEDFSRWYLDVIREAELADYGPVRGTMVIRPYGYAIWEGIQSWLDKKFKETGHSNMYFPQFIPYSFIEKEASHVEGFSPELALVTVGGGKELEEKLVVRPTSETIVNYMFAQWVQSYRDLPLLINQWANVTRWEMRTRPFVRTLEFLWQEGHTAHTTLEEAEEEALRMIRVYEEFAVQHAAIPVVVGRKSRMETFAGALCTYTIEAMMGDRKALQAGTSHNLAQNFAKAFGTQFLDENGERQFVWQTSWGMSTRMVGGVIMTHGDDAGLMLPPRLAPIQVVIVPIWKKDEEKEVVLSVGRQVEGILKQAGVRAMLDASEQRTPGWKFNFWEMKVSRRFQSRLRKGTAYLHPGRRDRANLKRQQCLDTIKGEIGPCQNIVEVSSYEELKAVIAEGKWAKGPWAGSDANEAAVKEETGATIRCFPFDQPESKTAMKCLFTSAPAKEVAIFAKSY